MLSTVFFLPSLVFETVFHCEALAGLELSSLIALASLRYVSPCQAKNLHFQDTAEIHSWYYAATQKKRDSK